MQGDQNANRLLVEVTDYVLPVLPAYELSLYLYLLRRSRVIGEPDVRVGKRTISAGLGKSSRASQGSYNHMTEKLNQLAQEGFIRIGDTDRQGTLYAVALPEEVPAVREQMALAAPASDARNYFRDPELRLELFDRDKWLCRYCGEVVTNKTATLDHVIPVSQGGSDDRTNLATACLTCNSIKSGRTIEEAAPRILEALRARRSGSEAGSAGRDGVVDDR